MSTVGRNILIAVLASLAQIVVHAQPSIPLGGSCNEGRAVPPRVDPRHRYIHCLQPWGWLIGEQLGCTERAQYFGAFVAPLGDVNHDAIADWIVGRVRCDTTADNFGNQFPPEELLLYKGVRGGLPESESGERIGPSELGSVTTFLASGDWDADGHRNLAVKIRLFNDTSHGNTEGYDISSLVIFWGNVQGQYSINDTSRLRCQAQTWMGITRAISLDLNADGVDDLLVRNASGFSAGALVGIPRMHLFSGSDRGRWGRNGVIDSAIWRWWEPPPFNVLMALDHDCDGVRDLVMLDEQTQVNGRVSVLYRSEGALPDTNQMQTIGLDSANGKNSLFTDVTGDGVPELAVNCGAQEKIKLYAGRPGQRLLEQYGTGNEPQNGKPWASISLPAAIHDGWFAAGFSPLYDLGDASEDGLADLWTYSWPFLIVYGGGRTGEDLDSFIDVGLDTRDYGTFLRGVRLGDVDGSGKSSYALTLSGNPGIMYFFKGTDSIPGTGDYQRLPHAVGFRCQHLSEVAAKNEYASVRTTIGISVNPNPATGEILVRWRTTGESPPVLILHDIAGQELRCIILPAGAQETRLSSRGLPAGSYLLSVRIGTDAETTRIVLQ